MKNNIDLIVIGAGAAGLTAARIASENGLNVLVIERNSKPGRKIAITGKGRCNVTNFCDREGFFSAIKRNPRFLYSAFSAFDNHSLMEYIESKGVELKVERGNRVFPVSDNAFDIVDALYYGAKDAGCDFRFDSRVKEIITENNVVKGVLLHDDTELYSDKVLIATGGISYPTTGSTGDGYIFAKSVGHSVTDLRPSLIGIETDDIWTGRLAGLSLYNVTLTAKLNNKTIFSELGEMLFTHLGISGPLVLSLSAEMEKNPSEYEVFLDLKPGMDFSMLEKRVLREIEEMPKKHLGSMLDHLLPKSLSPIFADAADVNQGVLLSQLTKADRTKIINTLKHFPISCVSFLDIKEAIVTRGGVSTKEISPKTMESKLINGLYFAGEVIDVDGRTGGFNLQCAFSTGYLAGLSTSK